MKALILWIIAIIVIAAEVVWYVRSTKPTSTLLQTTTSTTGVASSSQTTSDGTITFATPRDFGLATTPQQVVVKSYIPPCEEEFNYCLYYNADTYKGTNFESAGLSITKLSGLTTTQTCMTTPPQGYDTSIKPTATSSTSDYSTSVFENIGDAGAGHYASGTLYRLFIQQNSSCYEFLLRIGETQFANYPAGTIKEFTDADRQSLNQALTNLLQSITFANGEQIRFPKSSN